jgi:SPP1 family predicted phage head-tail adaptor
MPHRGSRIPIANRLDRLITIQSLTKAQGPIYGEPTETYSEWKTVWACVTPWQGREFNKAGQITAEVDTKFHIRYLAGMSPTMRIIHDGLSYDIYRIEEAGRHDRLNIYAKARRE